ncbi:MAG: enoyl-CoA hydratase/isomerase family protein [Aurantimicrobium sp.]|nr:enoyl-CoA hydratase/isomerase family protein [Aurantimicrobium sp.]
MTDYDALDYAPLLALAEDEVVTHALVRDVRTPSGKTIALITLDNGYDYKRPNTLGPRTLEELNGVLVELQARASRREIDAVAITGKQFILAAGADLSKVNTVPSVAVAKLLAQQGHRTLGRLGEMGVPSFAFVNGLALGGGLEVALNANYRTVDSSVGALGLPEVFLGLIPGWGGATLLPHLVGIRNALRLILENPLRNNRLIDAATAHRLGVADVVLSPIRFLEDSLAWADGVLAGRITVRRKAAPGFIERTFVWPQAIRIARKSVASKIGRVAKSPFAALDLLEYTRTASRGDSFAREDEILSDLISGDQFQASMYAFNLVQKHAKKPTGAPDPKLAQPVTKVGVIGAGLMARQFALLFVRRLKVPVVLTDINQQRLDEAVAYIHGEIASLKAKGRLSSDETSRLQALVTGTTDKNAFADADWVIEAVFEELSVKQEVFASFEKIIAPTAVFATNTSSLSVAQIGSKLKHPGRLVGFHFFNPVAVMPLVEVVRADATTDETLATAMKVAVGLRKTAVITSDTTGFVVNRLLAKVLGEAMHAVDTGTHPSVVDAACAPFGLPMPPFVLLDLVGLKVGAHVLDTHHAAFPDRFFDSENLHKLADYGRIITRDKQGNANGFDKGALAIVRGGTAPVTAEVFKQRLEDGLADEIHRMLAEGVVASAADIDLCMIMGAGWPFQMGGITPYLDRCGASERVFGDTFNHPRIAGVTAA